MSEAYLKEVTGPSQCVLALTGGFIWTSSRGVLGDIILNIKFNKKDFVVRIYFYDVAFKDLRNLRRRYYSPRLASGSSETVAYNKQNRSLCKKYLG